MRIIKILLFDKDFNFLDIAYEQIDGGEQPVGSSTKTAHDHMTREYTVREEGFAYVYISNESPTYMQVYFDDVIITHTPTRIIQYNEYYPYGLQTGTSWTRENNSNNFLYNAGSELNETSGWYETTFRDYDPVLGRFMQVDPLAIRYASLSGYHYGFNNPVTFNDPNGAEGEQSGSIPSWLSEIIRELMQSKYGGRWDGNGYSYYTSAQQAYQAGVAYNDYHNSWGYTYYGSRRASAHVYRNMKRTGSNHVPSRSHFVRGDYKWNKENGSNIAFTHLGDAQQGGPNIYSEISNSFNETKRDMMFSENVGLNALFNVMGHYSVHKIDGKYYFNASAGGTTPAKSQGDVTFQGKALMMVNGKVVSETAFVNGDGYGVRYPDGFSSMGGLSVQLPTTGTVMINLQFSYHIVFGSAGQNHSSIMTVPVYIRTIGLPRN